MGRRGPKPKLSDDCFDRLKTWVLVQQLGLGPVSYDEAYEHCIKSGWFKKDKLKYKSFVKNMERRRKDGQWGEMHLANLRDPKHVFKPKEKKKRLRYSKNAMKTIMENPDIIYVFFDTSMWLLKTATGSGKVRTLPPYKRAQLLVAHMYLRS